MTMAMGAYHGDCKVMDVLKVWLISYIGNFVGAFILSAIFVGSGASHDIMVNYYNSFIDAKLAAAPMQLEIGRASCRERV